MIFSTKTGMIKPQKILQIFLAFSFFYFGIVIAAPLTLESSLVGTSTSELEKKIKAMTSFHESLDSKFWVDFKLKPSVRDKSKELVINIFEGLDIPSVSIEDITLTGSNASYEYDDYSDFGIHVFLNTKNSKVNQIFIEDYLHAINQLIEFRYEGKVSFFGVPVEIVFHKERSGTHDVESGVGAYSILQDRWLMKPAHNRSTFNHQRMLTDTNQFINQYNLLVKEYFSSKATFSCSRFIDLRKSMKKYRREGIAKNGIRSTENLTYRLLRRLNVNLQSTNEELSFDCENEHYSLKN